ncbi:hypothetical protein E8E12_002715 [Didymella heteroderae]|uniref:Uncharacterized protein n=1 Tax=Didymella heteroderae TaxID=1769908 RepID=A0A9P4X0S6_9PLEO|nr:hypothetical protein E8E12_002715 [Didymella heteroderae]
MALQPDEVIDKIRAYSKDANGLRDDLMELDATDTEARLAQTVKELRARVAEQQFALETLRAQSSVTLESAAYASSDSREKLRQLFVVKDAYKSLTPIASFLPQQGSVLPALLAARTLQQNTEGTKAAIASTQGEITKTNTILRREEANLNDAQLLAQAMENRTERLRVQQEDRSQKTPAQLAQELIAAKRAQKDSYDAATQTLGEAMNDFINDYLAAMIAAEELGGPVVGDMLNVEDNTLAAGFTKQGKAKSTKKPVSDKVRQRRIDHIWGNKSSIEDEEEPPTEAEAADAEMRQLIENLFALLIGPGGGKAYYQLDRDSAATRFLVRAKIAQFHPKDAKKLRLIEFGRELDD